MPASLAQLQARLDTLRAMRANGVLETEHNGARVRYRSVAELTQEIGYVELEMAQAGGATATRTFKITSSKDL